jgi:hypothetical protein
VEEYVLLLEQEWDQSFQHALPKSTSSQNSVLLHFMLVMQTRAFALQIALGFFFKGFSNATLTYPVFSQHISCIFCSCLKWNLLPRKLSLNNFSMWSCAPGRLFLTL